jgi:hypothetical protein
MDAGAAIGGSVLRGASRPNLSLIGAQCFAKTCLILTRAGVNPIL